VCSFLLRIPTSIARAVPKRSEVLGSGTSETVITAKSVPATKDDPDEGRSSAVMVEDPARKVLPSERRKLVWLRVAVNMAPVNNDVSGNCTGSVGLNAPGTKAPNGITRGEPALISVSEPLSKVSESMTGKSGGRANPPSRGSPVKLKILKTLTPGVLMSPGIKTSNEIRPMLTTPQNAAVGANSRSIATKMIGLDRRGMMHPPLSPDVQG